MKISTQDKRILKELQADGHISKQELAQKTAMSTSACWRRVRALEESGVIKRYTALVDANKVGLEFHALIHLHLTQHNSVIVESFISEVRNQPEVLDCFATTGAADYILRVLCKNVQAFTTFQEEFLFKLPGIANVHTNLILKEIKHETSLTHF